MGQGAGLPSRLRAPSHRLRRRHRLRRSLPAAGRVERAAWPRWGTTSAGPLVAARGCQPTPSTNFCMRTFWHPSGRVGLLAAGTLRQCRLPCARPTVPRRRRNVSATLLRQTTLTVRMSSRRAPCKCWACLPAANRPWYLMAGPAFWPRRAVAFQAGQDGRLIRLWVVRCEMLSRMLIDLNSTADTISSRRAGMTCRSPDRGENVRLHRRT